MPQHCFIGIDQGSSSTKALAVSKEGQVLFQTRRALPLPFRVGDRVEYDPSGIEQSVHDALNEVVQTVRASGFTPEAIGLSCQRSSCLAWNEGTGEALSPVISWRDMRGSAFVQQVSKDRDRIFEVTGLPVTPYYSASKFRWLRENMPALVKDTTVFGTLSSFLAQRLVNKERAVIDHTHAARTQLMNIRKLDWDPDLLAEFGLTGIRLPDIVPVVHDFGEVILPAGAVPLRASLGDQQAAMVGLGVLEQCDGGINYGTGGFLMVNTGTTLVTAKGLMASVHYSTEEEKYYLLEGSVNAAGEALEWVRSNLHLFNDYAEVDDLCWQAASDVVAFIGLNGTGAPHWENRISSSIHGMTPASTSADIVRATVEGIAFFLKEIAEEIAAAGLKARDISVSGGLAPLTYLVQVQSDILQKDLRVSAQQEVSALGAALLAGLAQGVWSPADIKNMVSSGEVVNPRPNPGASRRYRRWKELHRLTGILDRVES